MSHLSPEKKMVKAKISLVSRNPFFAAIAGNLKMIEVEPDHSVVKTLATNGVHLYYNPVFVDNLCDASVLFGVMHEVMHVVMMTFERVGSRNHLIWNCATDYVNNYIIKDSGFLLPTEDEFDRAVRAVRTVCKNKDDLPKENKYKFLYNEKYRDMTAEQVYEELIEETLESLMQLGTFDQHIGPETPDAKEGETQIWVPSESEEREIKRNLRDRIETASKLSGSNIPPDIKRRIGELTKPKINWRTLLRDKLTPSSEDDYSWSSPDMNYYSSGITIPTISTGDKLKAILVLDTSGSITSRDLNNVMSEINGICQLFHEYELTLVVFGTTVVDVQRFQTGDDVNEYEPPEGGGTSFSSFFEYISGKAPFKGEVFENFDEVDLVIVFTDGYGESWCEGYSSMFDLIWLINGNAEVVPTWGATVYYDKYQ